MQAPSDVGAPAWVVLSLVLGSAVPVHGDGSAMEVRTQQSGRLEDVSSLDLLQSLGIYRRAGHVVFSHPYGRSQLWFEAGAIVDAESGALHGAAAVYRIVAHDRGEYSVEVTGQARARTIDRAGSGLIFEAARRLDEGQRLRARLPAAEVVLALAPTASRGTSEEHDRVAALLAAGVTLGEVLERSGLGELETLQWLAELADAGQLQPTGVVRSPEPPASFGSAAGGSWSLGLEPPSQPFVPSSVFASHEGLDDAPPSRRRWWIHASVGAAVAAAITLAIVQASGGASAEVVASLAGPVTVIDASKPLVPAALVPAAHEPAAHEPALAVGASAAMQLSERDARGERAASPPRPTATTRGKGQQAPAREGPPTRAFAEERGAARPERGPAPVAEREDPSALLVAARRAYAAGDGASAHRLASRSQGLRPSDEAAELMVLSACQQQRPAVAAEALRAVPLLRRGSVRSTCKQAHGVRLKLGRGGR